MTPTWISKEVDATETMIERVAACFALKPKHLAGDVAYQRTYPSYCISHLRASVLAEIFDAFFKKV